MTTAPVGPISLGSVNANWPAMSLAVAFPDGPGPAAPSADWTELSTDGLTIDTARGTDQYEFSDVAAGTMDVLFDNLDGSLDPTNTASPHWPNVKLYRQIRLQATWQGVTYPIFTGNVERWPQQYVAHGRRAQVPLTAVDSLAVMQPGQLSNLLAQQMLSYDPAYYFPLDEPSGSAQFADVSGNGGSPQLGAVQYHSGGTYTAGQSSTLTDKVGAVSFAYATTPGGLYEVFMLRGANTSPGWANAANGFWVSFWFSTTMTEPSADIGDMIVSLDNGQWQNNYGCVFYVDSNKHLAVKLNDPTNYIDMHGTTVINDGNWHLASFRYDPTSGATGTASLYVDGVLQASGHPSPGTMFSYGYLYLSAGGAFRSNTTFGYTGSVCQLALLPNNAAYVPADVHTAGVTGYSGDTVGGRISRLLTLTGWAGPTSLGTSTTTEQAATGLAGTSLADGCKQAAYDGNGVLFVNNAGVLTYADRTARFNPTPAVTFGENSGETPYTDLELDYGPEYVYNDVQVTVNNGTTATTVNATSKDEYEDRVLTQTVNLQNPGEATDRAAYLAARYAQPAYRVAKLTVDLAANPAAFPAVLGLDIGSCVTVNRRPPGGSEISFPAFVERVEHHIAPGAWTCDLMCSPASGLTFWRLDDPVYSQLDHNYPIAY